MKWKSDFHFAETCWQIGTKWFLLPRKSASTSQNKRFVVKINLHYAESNFNCQEYLKNGKQLVSTSQKTRLQNTFPKSEK